MPSDRCLSEKIVPTFADRRVSRGQRDRSLRPYYRLSRPDSIHFLSSSSSFVLTRLSGGNSRPTTSLKIWYRQESNPELWICSQEVRPQVEVEVTLQLTVSHSVCQGIEPTLGLVTRYYFLSEGCFLKVAVLLCRAPSLTRGQVCHLSSSV
jgi:hypothetical protein